jgi:hypothetical protein
MIGSFNEPGELCTAHHGEYLCFPQGVVASTSFSETGMRFMAVDIELDDDIVGCELIDAMEEVPLITM